MNSIGIIAITISVSFMGIFFALFVWYCRKSSQLLSTVAHHVNTMHILEKEQVEKDAVIKQLQKDIENLQQHHDAQAQQINVQQQKLQKYIENYSLAQAQLQVYDENNAKTAQLYEHMKGVFAQLANDQLEKSMETAHKTQKNSLQSLLDPLKEKIAHFETTLQVQYNKSHENYGSLSEQLKNIQLLNTQLSDDAQRLASALNNTTQGVVGNKIRGDWGELILERVLELCGFVHGRDFFRQENMKTENGDTVRPDIVMRLPYKRAFVIDSKTSWPQYEQCINADTEQARTEALKKLITSIRNHIKDLAGKKYNDIVQKNENEGYTLDTVIMFIPFDAMAHLAFEADNTLYEYALGQKTAIIILTPSTLPIALHIIKVLWTQAEQVKIPEHARDIIKHAQILYEQFEKVMQSCDTEEKHLNKFIEAREKTTKYLRTGNGNMDKKIKYLMKFQKNDDYMQLNS